MPIDREDAVARVSKGLERLEVAPSEPVPTRPNAYQHREAWLHALMSELRSPFKRLGHPIPDKVRLTCGFPSVRGVAAKNQRIGECWSNTRSGDDHYEIMISPVIADTMRVG